MLCVRMQVELRSYVARAHHAACITLLAVQLGRCWETPLLPSSVLC